MKKETTLNELKKQVDELVQSGDGYRILFIDKSSIEEKGFQGHLRLPDVFDESITKGQLDKNKHIIIE